LDGWHPSHPARTTVGFVFGFVVVVLSSRDDEHVRNEAPPLLGTDIIVRYR
jgi:hypothetical protein